MTFRRALCALALLAAGLAPAAAQDLEVFELETFFDPEILSIEKPDGQTGYRPALFSHIRLGVVDDYQFRTSYTKSRLGFADLTGSLVFGMNQATVRVTGLDGLRDEDGPSAERVELRYGRYLRTLDLLGNTIIHRLQISWSDQNDRAEAAGTSWGLDWDFADTDADVVGGLSYSYQETDNDTSGEDGEPSRDGEAHHLSFDVRTLLWKPGEAANVDIGIGIGGLHRDGHTGWGAARLEISYQRRLWKRARAYVVYAPAYQLGQRSNGRRTNHEVAVFLHVPLAVKIFGKP